MPSPTPFDAEGDPNTPITSGVGVGAGVGPEALGLDAKTETRNLPPGMVQLILAASQRKGTSRAFRTMVRRAIADRK
jgi:hypothetical protein